MNSPEDNHHLSDAETVTSLRGERPQVVRLSRKAVGISSAIVLTLVAGALILALQPASQDDQPELVQTDSTPRSERLAAAPQDYSQVPKLGPPLPGDLGAPILEAQDRESLASLPHQGAPGPHPDRPLTQQQLERQQRAQEAREGLRSTLFAVSPSSPTTKVASPHSASTAELQGVDEVEAGRAGTTVSSQLDIKRKDRSPSSNLLLAGTIIPAALVTGIRSDQPGPVLAQVTKHVYDSLSGHNLVVPQGSRLIGQYSSDVGFGDRRVELTWSRLIFPDGRSIALGAEPATDVSGFVGLEDRVDNHWGNVLRAAFVSALLGLGGELGRRDDSALERALRSGGQESISRAGEQVVSRELGIRPTLSVRPGFPVRVIVTRDLLVKAS